MIKRWAIRGVLIFLILLCAGGWVESYWYQDIAAVDDGALRPPGYEPGELVTTDSWLVLNYCVQRRL